VRRILIDLKLGLFKCPWRDIIHGGGTLIPAKLCWAKFNKSLAGFLQIAIIDFCNKVI